MALLNPATVSIQSILPGSRWSLHQDISIDLDDELIGSIVHLGLLRPPIVRNGQDGYELICGARRLEVLRQFPHPPGINCSVLSNQAKEEDLLLLVAEDQIQSGPLTPIEAARFIALFNKRCGQSNHKLLSSATSTTSTTQRNRLLSLLQLEEPIRTSIHHGEISTKAGLSFVSLPSAERLFTHDLFVRLSLNGNKQHRFMELIQIITNSESCTIEEFITCHFPELCKGPIGNAPQQAQRLMKQLYERSHPGINRAKEEFIRRVSEMNLPKNCRITPSHSFEKDKVTLEVEFDDYKACSEAWKKMKKII